MGRNPKPWYRADRDAWFATVAGKRHRLADGKSAKKEADRQLHRLLGAVETASTAVAAGCTLEWLVYRFLDHCERSLSKLTLDYYTRHLGSLVAVQGQTPARDLRPHHVLDWLSQQTGWGPTTQAGAITSVKRLYRWARKVGHLDSDPLAELEKPRPQTRQQILSADQFRVILAGTKDRAWRDFLTALWLTGCRPGEVAAVTAANVDLARGTWTVTNKTRYKTTPTRTVYLTAELVEICRALVARNPTGPIFRNARGGPWTRNAMACRFARIRQRLGYGPEATAYSFRHLYATDALESGVPIATVSELLGHADTKMVATVYSKLAQRTDHLRSAARQVRPPVLGAEAGSLPGTVPGGRSPEPPATDSETDGG